MFIKPLLLLALGFRALSLPTTDEALGKRDSSAWITSFDITDTGCTNAPTFNDRPTLSNGNCAIFPFTGGMVGGRRGDIDVIEAFGDETCTAMGTPVNITRTPGEKTFCTPPSALGPLGCESVGEGNPYL